MLKRNPRNPNPPAKGSPKNPGPKAPKPNGGSGLTGDQQNAYHALVALFTSFGLDTLAPEILKLVKQGVTDPNMAELMLQTTDAWKTRFAGNEERRKAGLNVLSPASYLDLENTYDSVLKQFGIPAGMFGRSDFAEWIGKDVSPSEIQGRVQMAAQAQYNSDQAFSDALAMFGVDRGHQIAHFLDQSKALPFLQQQFQAAQLGSSALRHNLGLDPTTALAMASLGITADQAESGYASIANNLPVLDRLAQMEGGGFSQHEAEQATFFGDAASQRKVSKLVGEESARFSGSGGLDLSRPNQGPSLQGAY